MSQGMNKVFLMGNIGGEPELRWTKSGQAVLNFSIATDETYLDRKGERRETTHWHRAVVWGRRGEALAKILHTGSRVMIEGTLRTSSWDDDQGNKRYKTEVNVRELYLLSSAPAAARSADSTSAGALDFSASRCSAPAEGAVTAAA